MERLTPRGIALGHLVHIYGREELSSPDVRNDLAIALVEQVGNLGAAPSSTVIEPGLPELLSALSPLPREILDTFEERLAATTEPDDLWDLFGSLGELVAPATMGVPDLDGPFLLERSSMLGLFVRRIVLAFRSATFEEVCTLITHFCLWVKAPAADDAGPAESPPAWCHVLPMPQLEEHVQELVRKVEEGLAAEEAIVSAMPAGGGLGASASAIMTPLEPQVKQLLALAPQLPQVPMHTCGLIHLYTLSVAGRRA